MKVIQSKKGELEDHFKSLLSLTKKRQVVLDDSLSFYQLIQVWKNYFHYSIKNTFLCFFQVFEEEGQWYDKKLAVCSATIKAEDLRAVTSLQQKHKALEGEMVRRQQIPIRTSCYRTRHDKKWSPFNRPAPRQGEASAGQVGHAQGGG